MLKVGQKLYKQHWLLEKLSNQQDRKKKTRGLKNPISKAAEERKNAEKNP